MSDREFKCKGDLAMHPESVGLTWPRAPRDEQMSNGVCVISINGPLEHKGNFWSWFDSYERILTCFEGALRSNEVTGIILKIDSPGGEVSGLNETVKRMRALKKECKKPVLTYADDEAYSAAYALATVGDEIYLPESGGVGSVGVLATLCDRTEATKKAGLRVEVVRSGTRKAEGHPDIPLSEPVIGRVQKRVDGLAKQFFALVAEVRPTNRKALEALQGQCLYGKKAVSAGLADSVLSFEDVLAAFTAKVGVAGGSESVSVTNYELHDDSYKAGDAMKPFAALEKKVADAIAAVMAAKNPTARKEAAALLTKAQSALTEAKVKKTYNKKTIEEETEEDDGNADDDGDDDDDDDDDDDGPPSSEKASGEDEEKDMKKSKKASASSSLSAFVKSLTGQSSTVAAQQVLASMHEQAQQNAANAAEIAKLKSDAAKAKVDTLVAEGVAAGKIKPAQLAWAKTLSTKDLKAFLEATPALFSPRQAAPGVDESASEDTDSDGLTATERQICQMSGVSAESYKKQRDLNAPKLPKGN